MPGKLGQTGHRIAADINDDGLVNIARPRSCCWSIGHKCRRTLLCILHVLEMITSADVRQWLSQAQQLDLINATVQRQGVLFLQQLLITLTPKETALLGKLPKSVQSGNMDTISVGKSPADVTLHIYAVNGTLVRTLTLGHQPAGMYQSRSRAAYWDGRNAFGEPVASGLYFYTLTARDFTATRKMLIRK